MARQLGHVTVAEGIETLPDWQLVRDSGCAVGQGYLVAPAMPAELLPDWLEQHASRLLALRVPD
jgi:EAL domain-containing protein (putative c-di-GMP-specific phosphodiesterase class I)